MIYFKAFIMCFVCYFTPHFMEVFTESSFIFSHEVLFFIGGSVYGGYIQKHIFIERMLGGRGLKINQNPPPPLSVEDRPKPPPSPPEKCNRYNGHNGMGYQPCNCDKHKK